MEVVSESSKETQCDLDGFHTGKIPHAKNYKCDYCATLWISVIDNFPLGNLIETVSGRRLCPICQVENQERLLRSTLSPDVWNKRCWLDCYVKYEDFYCCHCNGRGRHVSVITYPSEYLLIHSYVHFPPHKICHHCFISVFTERARILHPDCCEACKRGPFVNTPLRHEVPT